MKLEKITERSAAGRSRWYDDACGAAHALELLGERWALLIVRELMFGPRRFGALRADLPGISANVLTQRLEGLERSGIVLRGRLPPPAAVSVYELTPWGYESEPIFQALGRWAVRSPGHDPTLPLSAASLMLSFRTMYDATRLSGPPFAIGFRIGEDAFLATVGPGGIAIERRAPETEADVTLVAAAPVVAALVYGKRPLAELEAAGALQVRGERALAERFAASFELPEKASAPAASGP